MRRLSAAALLCLLLLTSCATRTPPGMETLIDTLDEQGFTVKLDGPLTDVMHSGTGFLAERDGLHLSWVDFGDDATAQAYFARL